MIVWFLCFVLYCFWGWLLESLFCSLTGRRFVNRGFLNGPLMPCHGLCAVAAVYFLYGHTESLFLLLIAGVLFSCAFEYMTAFILEKTFGLRFWDYSHTRVSIHGRVNFVRLPFSAILCAVLVLHVHSHLLALIALIPSDIARILAAFFVCVIGFDTLYVIRFLSRLDGRLREIQTAIDNYIRTSNLAVRRNYSPLLNSFRKSPHCSARVRALIIRDHRQTRRLILAFLRISHSNYPEALYLLKT